ncbi:MAG TPA: sugar transferase [Caulobacterales bacterium]|nr:sugar transferase [Caulobacterales bacterium]
MANHMFETGSGARIPFRGRQTQTERANWTTEFRSTSRITDHRLIRRVQHANGRLKRAFDIIVSVAAIIFLAPALLTIALAIKISDPGPILYRHLRIGRQGARFECFKFRTMAVDSQERLAYILSTDPNAAAEWRESQKLRKDPRVTKIGAFLRKSSLDELPQLFNVLRGDMSIIGPRPITRAELYRYGRERRYYLLVRPGITGQWQVSGRSSTGYDKRVQYDRQYLENWSWGREIWILLMTIPAVLKTKDAC